MSDGALVVIWGHPVRGREHHALEVFGEALAYYARLQAAGEIESFEPIALEPTGGTLAGMLVVRGDPEKLSRVRASDEFLRLNNRTLHVVDNLGVHAAFLGQRLQQLYADWGAQSAALSAGRTTSGMPAYTPA